MISLLKDNTHRRHESVHGGDNDEYKDIMSAYEQQMRDLRKTSDFFHSSSSRTLPTFSSNEVRVGGILGMGGFCVVREVTSIQLDPIFSHLDSIEHKEIESREFMSNNCHREGHSRYAIKRLKTSFEQEKQRYRGMMDLAIEAEYLSREFTFSRCYFLCKAVLCVIFTQ